MNARPARDWLYPISTTNRAKGVENNMSSPCAPNRIVRPTSEIIADLARALARARAASDHARETKGEVPCELPSTVVTAPISKTRDR